LFKDSKTPCFTCHNACFPSQNLCACPVYQP
jgi:hypothetical protein